MALTPGTRLEHYDVRAPLGAGGMGEVYRASDTKLKRDVALKVLPPIFANDPARLALFEREAQVLASLNHPNIAAIYGLEHVDGIRFLVLELVEGPTLAERIASGPIPAAEAIRIATQIAEAMEAAHEKGVIHRDLKPANVKLTSDGKVKVLDFGLAKALGDPDPPLDPANSPTMTMQETRAGIVMGTAAYMSPEQASGKAVDKRADIWAFGVVLYEMLTGRKVFDGKTVAHILVHIAEQEPDWSKLPPLPSAIQDMLERCLQKDPTQRLRDIGDVRIQLQVALSKGVAQTSRPHVQYAKRPRWIWPAIAALVIIAAAVLGFLYLRPKPPAAEAVRFEITQPARANLTSSLSVSPDGRRLAFVATGADQRVLIWVRSMETFEARPLDSTEGVDGYPFWSPDSRWIAFATQDKLKKVEAAGGPAQVICDLPSPMNGGFWSPDNKIVFAIVARGLFQVSAMGVTATSLTAPKTGSHNFPAILPDGRHFVYTANRATGAPGIYLGSLDAKPDQQSAKQLLADSEPAVFASSPDPNLGYLLFSRGAEGHPSGTLMAQPLDLKKLEILGEAVPVAEDVDSVGFSASSNGVLVYRTGPAFVPSQGTIGTGGQLTWFDRQGKVIGTAGQPAGFAFGITLSPDGTRVAFARGSNLDIWIFEFARGVNTRFTFDPAGEISPVWSPDSARITFSRGGGNDNSFFTKAANGAGAEELLFKPETTETTTVPSSWSPDGKFLLLSAGGFNSDMYVLSTGNSPAERKAVPLLKTQFNERGARFSPDGRWFSYTSNATGKDEAYVRPFDPATVSSNGGEFQISVGGGQSPHWRGDGKEIFYQSPDGTMMSVEVTTTPVFKAGAPKPLFKGPMGVRFWDVLANGQKFLMPVPQNENSPTPYKVVLNWTSTLKK